MNRKYAILLVFALAVLTNALPTKKKTEVKPNNNNNHNNNNNSTSSNNNHNNRNNGKDSKQKDLKKAEDEKTRQQEEEEDEEETEEEVDEDVDDEGKFMSLCLMQENVTEAEMKNFLMSKNLTNIGVPVKKAVLCFLKKVQFFDGTNWDVDNIAESIGENTKTFKNIKDCLKKDDKKLQAHERTYRVQKCVLEADARQKTT